MRKYFTTIGIILTLSLLIFPLLSISLAQEGQEAGEAQGVAEAMEYSFGTVSSVSPNEIMVTEYDYETNNEINVVYTVGPEVELQNVNSLQEIKAGDNIDIDYIVKDGKRIAKIIAVEKISSEEEYMPPQTPEEQPEPEYSPEETEEIEY